jgi:hypothetical protein
MGNWGLAPCILNLGIKWRWVVSFITWLLTPGERGPSAQCIGYVSSTVSLNVVENNFLPATRNEIHFLSHPVCSLLLYLLSYLWKQEHAHNCYLIGFHNLKLTTTQELYINHIHPNKLAKVTSVTDHMYVVLGRNTHKKSVSFIFHGLLNDVFSVSRLCSMDGMMTDEWRTAKDLEEGSCDQVKVLSWYLPRSQENNEKHQSRWPPSWLRFKPSTS